MSELLIGTVKGVWQLDEGNQSLHYEDESPDVGFLSVAKNQIWVLTRENALWMRSHHSKWQLINPQPVKEEVWSFAADSNIEGRLYLGVSPAMLYRSDDGGITWQACESIRNIPGYEQWTFPPPPHIPHVRFISPDPHNQNGIYIGVEVGGVYHSIDGGETWESLNEGLYWDVHTILPTGDRSKLYATTGKGFYRSDDGGHHWQHITAGLNRSYTIPCVISPQHPEVIYTAAAASPPPSWRISANAAIYRSDDGGEHWRQLQQGLPQKFDDMVKSLAVDVDGSVYAATVKALFVSFDRGENWQLVTENLPTVQTLALV